MTSSDIFRPNAVPEVITLKYSEGREVESRITGNIEYMFSLADGRRAYFPQSVAMELRALRIQAGEPFEIRSVGRAKGQVEIKPVRRPQREVTYEYENQSPGASAAAATQETLAPVVHQPVASPKAEAPPQFTDCRTAQGKILMACLLSSIDAFGEAQNYAKRKELGITFTPENVTSAALSIYISQARGSR